MIRVCIAPVCCTVICQRLEVRIKPKAHHRAVSGCIEALLGHNRILLPPTCRHRGFYSSVVAEIVVFGDMMRSSTHRGRAPADNSAVLAMFRLVYSGEGATQPFVDDLS